jgi:hypothetical protein
VASSVKFMLQMWVNTGSFLSFDWVWNYRMGVVSPTRGPVA